MHRQPRGHGAHAVLVAVLLLATTACGTDAPGSVSAYPAASLAAGTATTAASAVWTPAEATWLEGIRRLAASMEGVYSDGPADLTPGVMRDMATRLHTCREEVDALGAPSVRLRSVRALVEEGCAGYAKGARCLRKAADIGVPLAGSHAERLQSKAIQCGFRASGRGGVPMGDALGAAENIRTAALR